MVTKVGHGLTPTFKPGVVLEYWNGVPIDRAFQRYSEAEVGDDPTVSAPGRPRASRFARCGTARLPTSTG